MFPKYNFYVFYNTKWKSPKVGICFHRRSFRTRKHSFGSTQFHVVPSDWFYMVSTLLLHNHNGFVHNDVIKWKHFPRYWPFVREFTGPGEFPTQSQWRGALMFTLIWARINCWVNTREAGDLRRYPAHCDVRVMSRVLLNQIHLKHTLPSRCSCGNYYGQNRHLIRKWKHFVLIFIKQF